MLHNLILLGIIICREKHKYICLGSSLTSPCSSARVWRWWWGVQEVQEVQEAGMVDQGGGRGGDQQSARLTNRQNINKQNHENFAPTMPSIVDTSDNSAACSTCSFLHKSSQRDPGLSSSDDLPVSQPSKIFQKCVRGWWRSVTILSEILSWRRTVSYNPQPRLHLIVFILALLLSNNPVTASESPDRECCDGPKNIPGPAPSPSYPRYNYPPPEVPDFPEYGPHELPPRVPGYGPGTVKWLQQISNKLSFCLELKTFKIKRAGMVQGIAMRRMQKQK